MATVAIQSLLDYLESDQGMDVHIKKIFKPGSGLGSSASSASGAVFAANHLLGNPLKLEKLLDFALEGEALASKSYHADNVAPSPARGLSGGAELRAFGAVPHSHPGRIAGAHHLSGCGNQNLRSQRVNSQRTLREGCP